MGGDISNDGVQSLAIRSQFRSAKRMRTQGARLDSTLEFVAFGPKMASSHQLTKDNWSLHVQISQCTALIEASFVN